MWTSRSPHEYCHHYKNFEVKTKRKEKGHPTVGRRHHGKQTGMVAVQERERRKCMWTRGERKARNIEESESQAEASERKSAMMKARPKD